MINSIYKKAFNQYFKQLNDFQKYKDFIDSKFIGKDFLKTKKNIYKLFDTHTVDYYVYYCFLKIREWIVDNEQYTEDYILNLEKLISKHKIKNKLGSWEIAYINHFKAVIFNKKRNLKRLIADFPLEEYKIKKNSLFNTKINESVYFSFENSFFGETNKETLTKPSLNNDCEIHISNFRIIINKISYVVPIYFKFVETFKMEDGVFKLVINNTNNQTKIIYLTTYDNYVLYVSFQRIYQLWSKNFQK